MTERTDSQRSEALPDPRVLALLVSRTRRFHLHRSLYIVSPAPSFETAAERQNQPQMNSVLLTRKSFASCQGFSSAGLLGAHASCVLGVGHPRHAGSVRSQGRNLRVLCVSAVRFFLVAAQLLCVHLWFSLCGQTLNFLLTGWRPDGSLNERLNETCV